LGTFTPILIFVHSSVRAKQNEQTDGRTDGQTDNARNAAY